METVYLTYDQIAAFVAKSVGAPDQRKQSLIDKYFATIDSGTLADPSECKIYAANYMIVSAIGLHQSNPFPQFVSEVLYGFDTNAPGGPPVALFRFHLALFNDELKKRK